MIAPTRPSKCLIANEHIQHKVQGHRQSGVRSIEEKLEEGFNRKRMLGSFLSCSGVHAPS